MQKVRLRGGKVPLDDPGAGPAEPGPDVAGRTEDQDGGQDQLDEAENEQKDLGPFAGKNLVQSATRSVELLQVHASVQAGNLIGVTIKHEGFTSEDFAQTPLRGLAPTRMLDLGIHV